MLTTLTRRALIAAFATAAALVLAGCSTSGTNATSDDYSPPDKNIEATINFAQWSEEVAGIDANISSFNKIYPNIHVNVNVTPWDSYWQKLQTQASSDTLPDVFTLNGPNFALYAGNGKVEPITKIVAAGDIDPSNYPKALNDIYTLNNVSYGVARDFDTIGLWYNKAIFQEAGVEVPTADWTWEDFQKAAVAISDKLGSEGIFGAAGGMDGQSTYYNTIAQAGGHVISDDGKQSGYDSPEAQSGLKFWTDLIASGGSPTMQQLTDTPALGRFTSGKLGMLYAGSFARTAITDSPVAPNVQVAPLPEGKQRATVIHGVANVVSASSKNKQAAQAFQVYLATKEAQQEQGASGVVIPAYNGTQDAFVNSLPGVDLGVFIDATKYAVPYPVSKNTAAWAALETEILPGIFDGSTPVKDGTNELATKMNDVLANE